MRNINKFLMTGLMVMSAGLFAGCDNDGSDKVGRDKGVPNGMEENYTGDADHNRTGKTEEAVKSQVRDMNDD